MKNFNELDLPQGLQHTLAHMGFEVPTPIQVQAIPPALEGKDILGSAQTGTGKTGAFGIPLVARLLTNPRGSAMVLTPTRELAMQVMEQLKQMLGKRCPIKAALLIGGESMPKQIQALRNRPRLLIGTPGRINDHLERGTLMLHDTNFLVLDETDRMLDMGFTIQIEKILKFMPKQRQTLLFSATLPNNIVQISKQYLNDPVHVSVGATSKPAAKIKQEVIHIAEADKYDALKKELDAREGSIIVFIKTKHGAEKMAAKLAKLNYSADAIHGDLRQNKRDRVITAFRDKKYRILIATDIAARGLDIPHIEHVINYDLPQCPEDYIHRIGRTARAGAEGSALCFITPKDKLKWNAIERLLDPSVEKVREERDYSKKSSRSGATSGKPAGRNDRSRSGSGRGRNDRNDRDRSKGPKRDGKPASEKGFSEKKVAASGAKSQEKRSDKPRSDKPRSDKPRSDKPRSDKPRSDKLRSSKPAEGKSFGSKKPAGKAGAKPFRGKPSSKGGKPVGSRAGSGGVSGRARKPAGNRGSN